MELIFNLLKQLASSLTPSEFLIVLILIAMTSFSSVRFFQKLMQKGGIFGSSANNPEINAIENIRLKLESVAQAQADSSAHLLAAVEQLGRTMTEQSDAIKNHSTEYLLNQKDFEVMCNALRKDIADVYHIFKMHDLSDQQTFESFKTMIVRGQDIMHKISSQVEKIDEFSRAAVPEFKTYHKDLAKEVSDLSRDIALLERGLQSQSSSMNNVNLR